MLRVMTTEANTNWNFAPREARLVGAAATDKYLTRRRPTNTAGVID